MEREERQHLTSVIEDVKGWAKRARKLVKERQHITADRTKAAHALAGRLRPRGGAGGVLWRTLNLTQADGDLVTAMARGHLLPAYSPDEARAMHELTGDGLTQALHDAKSVLGARRLISGKEKKDAGVNAATWLDGFHAWLATSGFAAALARLEAWDKQSVLPLATSAIMADHVGFAPSLGHAAELFERHELDSADRSIKAIDRALQRETEYRSAVTSAANALRQVEAQSSSPRCQ